MSDQDLFDDDKGKNENTDSSKTNQEAGSVENTSEDLLKTVLNENGEPKYSTVEDLAKGAANAQDHIKNLEAELATLRDKGNASDKLDELMEAVKESKGSGQGDENTSTMKPEDVLGIVKDYLTDTKAAESRETNISTVTSHFKSRYGKDASEKLYGKAEDLGFSREEINRMIANNPNAALKVLGEDKAKSSKTDPLSTNGVSTSQFSGKSDEKPTSVMGPTTSARLTDSWKASQRKTLERLGYNPDEVKYQ